MRLFVDGLLSRAASMGSPGVDELRWLRPVRPGHVLRARYIVESTEPSASRADRGTVHGIWEMLNQNDEVVMTLKGRAFIARRSK